ncbi:MAG TPA: virulence RhuM family protein [Candidatus Mediterraneibacter quadrami]|uniref:Virulence RhuM family protein n=1 Tax=Candidatus Mediterraneibacter quadrami TaxID=2838684 RepID=A0A9D2RE40_9FIRM|nr:virulence RhuM family protein [Candidatus Mediterraneibacter quadrami]
MQESNLLMYTTEDGLTKIEATFVNDTVWLSMEQMAELFQRDRSVIGKHIRNIFKEGELKKESVWAKFAHTADDGKTYQVDYYNLDVIISVGYRVKSLRGTQFRIWATNILKEYMQKGFALDDDRLKRLGGGNYFDELLERIRDIRSSEKVFWRKVLEIYATSIDYDPRAESSILFFKQVQNKMHWAAHKHTAAEVIYQRADAEKEHMGLTSWQGKSIKRTDVEVAKNYLDKDELDALNKIVTAYLDIAEVHALNHEPMYMKDWLETIDDYLKMTRRDILKTKGSVTHKQALEKAHEEYEKYKKSEESRLSSVEQYFFDSIDELEGLEGKAYAERIRQKKE